MKKTNVGVQEWDDEEAPEVRLYPYVLIYVLILLQPLFSWALGFCSFQQSLPLDPLSLLLRFSFVTMLLYVVWIGPIIYFAYPEISKIKTSAVRGLVLFLFVFPPLFGFAWYEGEVKHLGALQDLIWSTFPLVILSVAIYEKTRSLTILSLGMSSVLFFNLFLVGDILGPYRVVFHTIPKGEAFYFSRGLMSLFILSMALCLCHRSQLGFAARTRERGMQFLYLMFMGLVLEFGLPFLLTMFEPTISIPYSRWDYSFCFLPVLLLLGLNRKDYGAGLYRGVACLALAIFVGRVVALFLGKEASFWTMSWAGYYFISAVVVMGALWERRQAVFSTPRSAGISVSEADI